MDTSGEREQLLALVAEIRAIREQVIGELADVTEAEFRLSTATRPWPWTELWMVLLQFGNHMREHATHIQGTRQSLGRAPS